MAKQKGDQEGDYGRPQSKPSSKPPGGRPPPPPPGAKSKPSSKGGKGKSTSAGSRSSGGGSGASPADKKRAEQNYRVVLGQLRQQFPFDISRYIEETIRLGESADYLYARITGSPEFKASFPGIFRPDGTLRYSPSEYQSLRDDFTKVAAQYGFGLSQAQLGGLIGQGKTAKDFELDAKGIQLAKMNPDFVKRFNEQIRDRNANLIRQGQKPIRELGSFKDAVDFFTGRAPQEVYDLYEAAMFATSAKELAKEGILEGFTNVQARNLAAQTAGVMDIDDIRAGFQNIAQAVREAGVDIYEFGLDEEKMLTLEFGGKGQGQYALLAAQALKQARAKAEAQQASSFIDYQSAGGRPTVLEQQEASL